jgi:hypothetical protein
MGLNNVAYYEDATGFRVIAFALPGMTEVFEVIPGS